jgi:hypothetical protein
MNIYKRIFIRLFYILKNIYFFFNIDFYQLRNLLKKKNFDIIKKKNKKLFLFEHFESLNISLIKTIVLPILARNLKADLYCYNLGLNLFYYKLYKSFGLKNKISINLNKKQKKIAKSIYLNYFSNRILNKKDIFNFKIQNIHIGIDIYESYLIRYNKPTLDLSDKRLFHLIKQAINIFIFWKDFLKNNSVAGIYINQRTYIENNILNRLAMKNKITVYSGGSFGAIQKFKKNIMTTSHTYKKLFNSLPVNERKLAMKLSRVQLKKRLSGEVGVDMSYSTKSAYHNRQIPFNFSSKKEKILICTHCFYDNPHPFGGSLFIDFYEWLVFLSKISHETDYEWYIKPHPDYLPGTLETLSIIVKKFKNGHLLDSRMSFHQISRNIKYCLTSHGSIAHELPLLGMYVINADKKNPHQSFNFSYTVKNLKDYKNILLNLNTVKKKIFNIKDIYKFYYVHYYFFNKNNFFQELAKIKNLENSKKLIKDFTEMYVKNKNFNIDINNQISKFLLKKNNILKRIN